VQAQNRGHPESGGHHRHEQQDSGRSAWTSAGAGTRSSCPGTG
jgi:hypothetical protein